MKLGRRALLAAGLGATQMALLSRFTRSARAGVADGPTKMLTLYVPGGLHHELVWCPFSAGAIERYIPPPTGGAVPTFYNAAMVENLDGSGDADADAPIRRLRAPVHFNWDSPSDDANTDATNPASGGAQRYTPNGYAWAAPEHAIHLRTALIHGVDQGTAAHASGRIAGLCGVAGGNFGAPAVQAVVANHFAALFPDRPLANVSIGGRVKPLSTTLPSVASPIEIGSTSDLEFTVSDARGPAWDGLRTRLDVGDLAFDGTETGSTIPLTHVDRAVLAATRGQRGRSSAGTDTYLEQLHDGYRDHSRLIARNVVDVIAATPGVEHLPDHMPWAPGEARFGWRIGHADAVSSGGTWESEFDIALRLLKSDLATSVTLQCNGHEQFNFDSHYANPFGPHGNQLRGMMEVIGRLLIEMQLTPSPSQPGKSLLDETLVYVFSDFGRTLPVGGGSDHNPTTTALLAGGGVAGNRMVGGFDESIPGSPTGVPVGILEESGDHSERPPRAADVTATILGCFGLKAGDDYFIPGGFGEIEGIRAES